MYQYPIQTQQGEKFIRKNPGFGRRLFFARFFADFQTFCDFELRRHFLKIWWKLLLQSIKQQLLLQLQNAAKILQLLTSPAFETLSIVKISQF